VSPLVFGCAVGVAVGIVLFIARDPGLYWGDPAELSLQARELGVTHPPGYPLYVALAHGLSRIVGDPAGATNAMSLVGTGLAVALLATLATVWAGRLAGLFAGVLFGFHPFVWPAAVRTEVFNVNMAVVAGSLLALLHPSAPGTHRIVCGIVLFALSLGTSPANVLLLPGIAVSLSRYTSHSTFSRRVGGLAFATIVALVIMGVWTMARARAVPPLGTATRPVDVPSFASFVTGASYDVFASRSTSFLLKRPLEHTAAFLADVAWIGAVLGVLGIKWVWRRDRGAAGGLLLAMLGNGGYVTFHPWPDYRTMMTPLYWGFAFFAGIGLAAVVLAGSKVSSRTRIVLAPLCLLTASFFLVHRSVAVDAERRVPGEPEEFIAEAASAIPAGSLVLTKWIYFTPLLYAQRVVGIRGDLEIVEVAGAARIHGGAPVDWRDLARQEMGTRPVVTNLPHVVRSTGWRAERLDAGGGWMRLYAD
jgi:hypothetical protein